jgi:low affinity Fe/Cu permease
MFLCRMQSKAQQTHSHTEPEAETKREQAASENSASTAAAKTKRLVARFSEAQSKDMVFYLSMVIIFVEMLITLVALCYGIITAKPPASGGMPQFNFPWLTYFIALGVAPAVLLLMVHLTGVGLLRSLRGHEDDNAWQEKLPNRIRRVYSLIQGAPVVVLLLGVILLGMLLFFVDGALGILMRMAQSIEQYLPWIIGGIAGIICVGITARHWFAYRSRKVAEEYAFRREVLEKTGVIIVDKGSMPLPMGDNQQYALPAAQAETLPPAEDIRVVDITPETPPPPADEEKNPNTS